MIHLAYHPSSPYSSCIFSQHNPSENDARTNYYGIYGGTPRVVVQGEVIPPASQLLTAGQIDNKLGMMSDYEISFKHFFGSNDTVKARITVKKLSGASQSNLRLFAVLAEKLIEYNAPNGEDMHHDVFRKVIADENLNLVNVGDSITKSIVYTTHPDWNQDEIFVAGMVQNGADKEILQAGASDFASGTSGINTFSDISDEPLFYPNPASDYISIKPEYLEQYRFAEVYNLFGKQIKNSEDLSRIDVSELEKGYYFLVLTDENNKKYTTKFIKS